MSLLQLLLFSSVCCYVGGADINMECPAGESLSVGATFTILQPQTETCDIPPRDEYGYEYNPGLGYYKFYTELMTWHDAMRQCENDGGHLAVIDSEEEATVLLKLFAEHVDVQEDRMLENQAFIGASYIVDRGNFFTVLGQRLDCTPYALWYPGEPNNIQRKPRGRGGEDCVTLKRDGKFNDAPCEIKYAFFCEKPFEDEK